MSYKLGRYNSKELKERHERMRANKFAAETIKRYLESAPDTETALNILGMIEYNRYIEEEIAREKDIYDG